MENQNDVNKELELNQKSSLFEVTDSEETIVEEEIFDPIDGTVMVMVSDKYSEAYISISHPLYGGVPITVNDAMQKLAEKDVIYGINKDKVLDVVNKGIDRTEYCVAKWLPPEDGIDGKISYRFEKNVENKPIEDARGFVDYHDLGLIRNIKIGTEIAIITLPTDGVPGLDVREVAVLPKKGVAARVDKGENVGLSGDGTRLIALADGNLKFSSGKFSIETVYNMRGDVDASTGNLDFIGDIIVKGEVHEGFKVTSEKNITIHENISGAIVTAGGDVIVKKGSINSTINAKRNVTVDFAENSTITCGGDIRGDAFVTSTVFCSGELIAQGKRGFLMGGKYTCLKNLTANSIGTKSYIPTLITVGDNAIMMEEQADCEKKIEDIETQILRCTQAIEYLTEKKKTGVTLTGERIDMLNSSIKQRILYNVEKSKIKSRINEIIKYLENKQNLSITCRKDLYPGTKITINDYVFNVHEKYSFCKIYLDEEGIKTETL